MVQAKRNIDAVRLVRPDLDALLKRAVERGVTEEELCAQRRSYVASEAALGSDADEAAYRAALERGDKDEIIRLDAEAEERCTRALKWMDANEQ
jgi:hypothetical protein